MTMYISKYIARGKRRVRRDRHSLNRAMYGIVLGKIRDSLKTCCTTVLVISNYKYFYHIQQDHFFRKERMEAALRLYCLRHPGATYKAITPDPDQLQRWTVDLSACPDNLDPLRP